MRGNPEFIKHKVMEREDSPLKDYNSISVILDEYEKEFNRLIQYSESTVIFRRGLGRWVINNSKLRGYIRYLIKNIRTIREKKIEDESKFKGHRTSKYEEVSLKRLKIALVQLDSLRGVFINRKEKYLEKKNNKAKLSTKEDNIE